LLITLCWVSLVPSCGSDPEGIWADQASNPQEKSACRPTRNSVYDGAKAVIAAARNETEGLVVRLRGQGGAVSVTDLKGHGQAVIPASAVDAFELVDAAGGYLDAIVPRERLVLADHGAALLRFNVPADAAPGLYRGAAKVGKFSLPVELTVWSHTLPRQPTFYRNAPHWATGTPNKPAGLAGAISEFDALWRARLTPAHSFWGKKPWWHFEHSMDVEAEDDWPGTDDFYRYYFESGGMQIDIDWFYAYPHGINMKGPRANAVNAIKYLYTCYEHFRRKFGAADRIFVQNRGDEPNLGQGKPGRVHCEYSQVIRWSRLIREAAPKLKILIAEHPAPQLFEWIDIFNSPWPHARGPDARELEKLGKRLMWYSPDIKAPDELLLLRYTYWRAFANNLHGAWTWERYRYMDPEGKNYRNACIYEPGKVGGVHPEVAVASMKLEAAGEGHDDFETLRLLESWAGDRFVALSFAQHTLKRTGPASPPQATDTGPEDLYPLRRTMAFLLSKKHVATVTFKDSAPLAKRENVELVTGDTGFVRLAPDSTTVFNAGGSLAGGETIGNARASVEDGAIRVEMTGGTEMSGIDFSGDRVSRAREVRFDIWVEPNPDDHDGLANMGLFDIFLRIDGRYGVGVNWKTGEYNRTLGHWSDSGSFPGAWRSVRCVLAHTIDAPTSVASVGVAIGRHGYYDTNDPLPGRRYLLRIRNVRVTSSRHKERGVIESKPIQLGGGPAYVWWVTEKTPLPGASVELEVKRGRGVFEPVTPLPGLMGVAKVPGEAGDAIFRLTLTGGRHSPYIHAVGFVTD